MRTQKRAPLHTYRNPCSCYYLKGDLPKTRAPRFRVRKRAGVAMYRVRVVTRARYSRVTTVLCKPDAIRTGDPHKVWYYTRAAVWRVF